MSRAPNGNDAVDEHSDIQAAREDFARMKPEQRIESAFVSAAMARKYAHAANSRSADHYASLGRITAELAGVRGDVAEVDQKLERLFGEVKRLRRADERHGYEIAKVRDKAESFSDLAEDLDDTQTELRAVNQQLANEVLALKGAADKKRIEEAAIAQHVADQEAKSKSALEKANARLKLVVGIATLVSFLFAGGAVVIGWLVHKASVEQTTSAPSK